MFVIKHLCKKTEQKGILSRKEAGSAKYFFIIKICVDPAKKEREKEF